MKNERRMGCSENTTEAPELLHARINFMGMGVAPRHEASFANSPPPSVIALDSRTQCIHLTGQSLD
jgi:hypothetical protein